ncbi:hypothetical protein PLESTB_001655800 [Pleodorina starrii]|uniref:von Hippel-Lindau disease tumour suppressor beta domain-containing protein n=1 Tax=Pleodorina starrii TaxID=330485 RepID=A0A9W6BZG0_9CHLO|nr:hypothetical protein PLESTB_001655800 [Pleodorina starrii]GLC69663.1 hypothetical protein PLESTF_000862000 [Pleodorina starrii]
MGLAQSLDRNSAAMDQAMVEEAASPKGWKFEDGDQVASLNSRFTVNMCFTNRTAHTVHVLWLNFDGKETSYGRIEPGATNLLYTYLTHPWVFRNMADPEEVLVVHGKPVAWPTQTDAFADVEEAPFLPWNIATHASTYRSADPAFARDVQNLLLAYYAQRKATGRSCDVASCRCGAARKSRRSSTGGTLDADVSPSKAAVNCCGVQLWHWRGLEGCNALHTAPAHSSQSHAHARRSAGGVTPPPPPMPSAPTATASVLEATAAAGHHCPQSPQAQTQPEDGLLGQLPFDIILEIIAKMAPKLRDYKPILKDDMEMMPRGVEPDKGPVALLAAKLLGPAPPPAPVVEPEAWFAAVNAGVVPGAQQIFGELGALVAQDGPLAPPVAPAQQQLALPQQQQQPADQAVAAVSPQVAAIMQYTEAAVLANTALMHAARMALQQQAQGQVLLRLVTAQQEAQNAAQQQAQGLQAPDGGAGGLEQGGGGAAPVDEQEDGDESGSEYGDAEGGDADMDAH